MRPTSVLPAELQDTCCACCAAPAGTPQRAAQAERIQHLSEAISALEGQVRELEAELQVKTDAGRQHGAALAQAKAEAQAQASRAQRLEQECEDLGRQLGLLQVCCMILLWGT